MLQRGVPIGILGEKIPYTVWRVFDKLMDILPGIVTRLETVP